MRTWETWGKKNPKQPQNTRNRHLMYFKVILIQKTEKRIPENTVGCRSGLLHKESIFFFTLFSVIVGY